MCQKVSTARVETELFNHNILSTKLGLPGPWVRLYSLHLQQLGRLSSASAPGVSHAIHHHLSIRTWKQKGPVPGSQKIHTRQRCFKKTLLLYLQHLLYITYCCFLTLNIINCNCSFSSGRRRRSSQTSHDPGDAGAARRSAAGGPLRGGDAHGLPIASNHRGVVPQCTEVVFEPKKWSFESFFFWKNKRFVILA